VAERLAIGLVGCGGMGHRHLRAYAALSEIGVRDFELAAVCDPRASAAEAAAEAVEALLGRRPAVYFDHGELISSGVVEAIDVVTDPSVHHLVAVPALEAGLHVICEKPLGVTVRACQAIIDAATRSGAVLATAENYRRDGPNRRARAVLEQGLLGELHLMVQTDIGGDDDVVISPWRHVRETGPLALDMGVHYTDIFAYLLGDLARVEGSMFVAEPSRVLAPGTSAPPGVEEVSPGVMRATGEDSLVALYETASGVLIQLSYVPSGPGLRWKQRSIHGRRGSMSVPPDRSGGRVTVQLGDRVLSGSDLRRELGDFELDGVTAAFFGPQGTEYDLPFDHVDAVTIGIELDDFIRAVRDRRPPEVDGRAGLLAVAAVWGVAESHRHAGSVQIADVAGGTISSAQDPVDTAIGLLPVTRGVPA
jgi:predicted dehydrogenase